MSYIGQAPGLGQRSVFRFVALSGQTLFTGRDAYGLVLAYPPGVATVIAINGAILSAPDYTATDGSTLTLAAPLPAGTEVLVLADAPFSPANTYTVDAADVRFTRKRNRIIDPGMRVSQENGNNSIALAAGYPSDSFVAYRSGSVGTANIQRIALQTPGGSPYRIRLTVGTANPNPGSGDYLIVSTRIEGQDVSDLRFGTNTPRSIAVRFGCRASMAGSYSVAIRNGNYNRAWIGSFTISNAEVGFDVVRTVTLSGDQSGSWATDSTLGLDLTIGLCAGTASQGARGWQNGNQTGLVDSTNLMATAGSTFDLFDFGLYEGSIAPPFELASYDDDLRKCQRYFQKINPISSFLPFTMGFYTDGGELQFPIRRTGPAMRSMPSALMVGTINADYYVAVNSAPQSGFSFTTLVVEQENVTVVLGKASHGISTSPLVALILNQGSSINFNARI